MAGPASRTVRRAVRRGPTAVLREVCGDSECRRVRIYSLAGVATSIIEFRKFSHGTGSTVTVTA
jgi:hypothetical protein